MSRYLNRKFGTLLPTWKKPEKDAEVIYQRGGTAPKGYVMVGTHKQPQHMGNKGTPKTYNVFRKMEPVPAAAPAPAPPPAPPPQAPPPMAPIPLPVNQPQQPAFNPMDMLPMLMAAMAPPPPQPIPEPVTYASAGQAAQSVPGVKIKKSPASISRQNTLGTRGAFNRNDLRISNLNI